MSCTFFPVCLLSAQLAVVGAEVGRPHTEKRHPCDRGIAMRYHSTGALTCDGPMVSTTLRGAHNLGRHNTAVCTLEMDSTRRVCVNIIDIRG